jgi:chemotaxis protein CheD
MKPHEVNPTGQVKEVLPGNDVFLMPGQLYFGTKASKIRTLLGSCVAVTLWHPARRIGGMCHYLLPERKRNPGMPLDGRYGEEALHMLMESVKRAGANPAEFEAHLYGGADTMPDHLKSTLNVGERNIDKGWTLIDKYGLQLVGVDVGENTPRNVMLELPTGTVDMKRGGRHA